LLLLFQVQGKDPSVDFTQELVEESEDERCFDDMNESVPPIELPPCELARLEEISGKGFLFTRNNEIVI
jgi:protein phosphatase-4 regulatory subunit 3